MKKGYRVATDSMGTMDVPKNALYGAQTARAVENFPISNLRFGRSFIQALGLIKKHSAKTNSVLRLLPNKISRAIQRAAEEVQVGDHDSEFVVDVFQTGSGTSTNMNANEVIANRAAAILGKHSIIHPNDHVNLGQSSNDVIPSTIHIAALEEITSGLLPSLILLQASLEKKSKEFKSIKKIGRTHLQDAVVMTLGEEFSGYTYQIKQSIDHLKQSSACLLSLPLGGTAVGTGINTHKQFARRTIAGINRELKSKFYETPNHFAAQASIDALVKTSGALRGVAIALIKIANDIRLLASGQRAGLGEIVLPALQPGSSIMPGKINPVMCEMVIQVGAQVIGNDITIAFSATKGNFELNTMLPVAGHNLLQSIELLKNASRTFAKRCIAGIRADKKACASKIETSLALATLLVPAIGYNAAAKVAKLAAEKSQTIREVARESSGLTKEQINKLLGPKI